MTEKHERERQRETEKANRVVPRGGAICHSVQISHHLQTGTRKGKVLSKAGGGLCQQRMEAECLREPERVICGNTRLTNKESKNKDIAVR